MDAHRQQRDSTSLLFGLGALLLGLSVAAVEAAFHRIDIGKAGDEAVIVAGPYQREGPRDESPHPFYRTCSMRWFPNHWTLRLPVNPNRHNRIQFRGKGRGFRIRIDDRTTYWAHPPTAPRYTTEIVIPAAVVGDRTELLIEGQSRPVYVVRPDARDKRELALAVDWITISPLAHLEEGMMTMQQLPTDVEPDLPLPYRLRGTEMRPLVTDLESYVEQARLMRCNVMTIGPMNGRHFCAFPSENGIPAPDMDPDFIPRQIEALHEHGIAAIGWLPFNVQDLRKPDQCEAANAYPQYRMQPIEWSERSSDDRVGMCIISSPWREIHAGILKEAAALGLDGVFFDGFYLGGIPHPLAPGCVCDWCRQAFRDDTGLDAPQRVDWSNPDFKRWIRWRNDKLVETACFFQDKMREANPDLWVTCNYNVWPFGSKDWDTAIPLWATDDYGTSQHAYTGRPDLEWVMLGFKARLSHDLSPTHADIWRSSRPAFKYEGSDEDVARHELTMRTFMLAGPTYGTTPWHGGHISPPQVGVRVHEAVKEREHLFSQNEFCHLGVLISQNTHDFYGHIPQTANLEDYRDTILGAWLLLTENHIPFRFIFDNQLTTKDLQDYRVLYLPNAACLTDEAAEALQAFAGQGGVVVTTGEAGAYDGWGERRDTNVLNGIPTAVRLEGCPALQWLRDRRPDAAERLLRPIKDVGLPYIVEAPSSLVVVANWSRDQQSLWLHMLNVSAFYPGGDTGFRGVGQAPVYQGDVASDANLVKGGNAPREHIPAEDVLIKFDASTVDSVRLASAAADVSIDHGRIIVSKVDVHETLIIGLVKD